MEEKTEKQSFAGWLKKYTYHVFIDGLSGMAFGLFATLIVGTIIAQIGDLIGGEVNGYVKNIAGVAKVLTGAGIGVGVAYKFKESSNNFTYRKTR